MSAGQEIGSPIRENRTLLPAPLPPDEARGTLAAAAGVSTVGLRPPFDTPAAAFSSRLSRRSHLVVAQHHGLVVIFTQVSAQAGSHSRNVAKAGSHGPDSCGPTIDVLPLSRSLMDLVSL